MTDMDKKVFNKIGENTSYNPSYGMSESDFLDSAYNLIDDGYVKEVTKSYTGQLKKHGITPDPEFSLTDFGKQYLQKSLRK